MSPTIDSTLQVIFVDALFLCLAGGGAFWFRAWLQEQQGAMDQRLGALEEQQQSLARICDRLTSICKSLERPSPVVEAIARTTPRQERSIAPPRQVARESPSPTVTDGPALEAAEAGGATAMPLPRRRVDTPAARADRQWEELTDRSREAYRRARDLLEQGVPPNDIARQVGLGVAEVNVLKRMRDAGRR